MKKWPFLSQLTENGYLLTIDYAFTIHAVNEQEACLLAALFAMHRRGHLCLKVEEKQIQPSLELITQEKELALQWAESIYQAVAQGITSPFVVKHNTCYYLTKSWQCEETFIRETQRLMQRPNRLSSQKPELPSSLTQMQQQAVHLALHYPLTLITGGPGTGKTFTAIQIANAFLQQGRSAIYLAAPTGKAAANLEKKLPTLPCTTLHSLLAIRSAEDFQKEPPWIHLDLLIIDECSMIDAQLFARLMTAVRGETHLVLMGDPNQLPAVEGGSFFADLIQANILPVTFLKEALRFEVPALIEMADAILAGSLEQLPLIPLPDEEAWIIQTASSHFFKPNACLPDEATLYASLHRFRLLSALRKGPFGIENLNEKLMRHLLSFGKPGDYFPIPIMITRNDSHSGLVNGQSGLLIHKIGYSEEDYALLEGKVHLPRSLLPRFEYAYATSVHKSQGSEYEELLLLVPEGSEAFGKELLYTAVTRAKQKITIAASKERIALMLNQHSGKVSGVVQKLSF